MTKNAYINEVVNKTYQHGFVTDIESDTLPAGLNEEVIRTISAKKEEPEFLLEWRLKAYRALADNAGAYLGSCSIYAD